MRDQRHDGRVGDLYIVREPAYANSRAGREQIDLEIGDLLLKLSHSGDCFCYYAVIRNGRRLHGRWAGYDGAGFYLRNIVDDAVPNDAMSELFSS